MRRQLGNLAIIRQKDFNFVLKAGQGLRKSTYNISQTACFRPWCAL